MALVGSGLAGVGVAGAAEADVARSASRAAARRALGLPPVQVSWDRVLRTTVGLRPHRDSGFVLRAESLGDKTLVHNYGHGGAGMSLGWGCGALAADLALFDGSRRAAVIGCGSPGLTAARQLQHRGFDVTIYAVTVPPDTTSNMSLATFTPASGLIAADRRTPAWDAQFARAAGISYLHLQSMVGPSYGVSWIDNYVATSDPAPLPPNPDEAGLLPDAGRSNREVLGPGDHPFPTRYAVRTPSLRIDPAIYLATLVREFTDAGSAIVIRRFESASELLSLPEPIVVNCTGLGSRTLFGDDELVPVKGQLTILAPQPEITYRAATRASSTGREPLNGATVGMTPRSDGIVLGNLQERGNWSLEPDEAVRQRVVGGAMEFFAAMKG